MQNSQIRYIDLPYKETAKLTQREAEQLQEIVIRAHYLALELRDVCAAAGVADPEMSRMTGRVLKNWALTFSAKLKDGDYIQC